MAVEKPEYLDKTNKMIEDFQTRNACTNDIPSRKRILAALLISHVETNTNFMLKLFREAVTRNVPELLERIKCLQAHPPTMDDCIAQPRGQRPGQRRRQTLSVQPRSAERDRSQTAGSQTAGVPRRSFTLPWAELRKRKGDDKEEAGGTAWASHSTRIDTKLCCATTACLLGASLPS